MHSVVWTEIITLISPSKDTYDYLLLFFLPHKQIKAPPGEYQDNLFLLMAMVQLSIVTF